MSSFIYFYSKFTEEFLLLGGAGIFTLLAAYSYHWVIKRRRLGAARHQVPASVVKAYLGQLINEAQFVRTQLFGLVGGDAPAPVAGLFLKPSAEANGAAFTGVRQPAATGAPSAAAPTGAGVPNDLMERLKSLEGHLAQKESLVVNLNVEKTKLLEEVENLKQNQKVPGNPAAPGAQEELLKKVKNLEERLEEYALFEDDLANLKRLQQENSSLKKRLEDGGQSVASPATAAAPEQVEPSTPTPPTQIVPLADEPQAESKKTTLDKNTINSLLDGETPLPIANKPQDDFEKLVDSVEGSLPKTPAPGLSVVPPLPAEEPKPEAQAPTAKAEAPVEEPAAPARTPEAAAPEAQVAASTTTKPDAAAPAAVAAPSNEKSDEELLKEFENLLNS